MARNGVKTGGRSKGTPNKKTAEHRERAERVLQLIESNHLEKDIKKLTPGQRMILYADMLEYVAPKLSRVTHQGGTDNALTIKIVRSRNKAE
jgi:hypothetical protein